MQQNKDFQPTQELQPCATCADCPMFLDFQGPRNRGWCSAFERIARTHHPRTNSCEFAIKEYQEQNSIEVAVTLCSHELDIDDDGAIFPKEERVISFIVPEFSRKAVYEAFEAHQHDFPGFYFVLIHRSAGIEVQEKMNNGWKYVGKAYSKGKLTKYGELASKDREYYRLRTRYLLLFLDENNEPLHHIPLRLGLGAGTGGSRA